MDALGSNIRGDTYGWEVKRTLPRLNEEINEEWISDKTRYACDGLLKQRIDKPFKRENGKLIECSWDEALNLVGSKIKETDKNQIGFHAGDMLSMETINSLKEFAKKLSIPSYEFREKPFYLNSDNKMIARLNAIRYVLSDIEYPNRKNLKPKKWSKESPVYNISLFNTQFNNLNREQYELLNRLKGHE